MTDGVVHPSLDSRSGKHYLVQANLIPGTKIEEDTELKICTEQLDFLATKLLPICISVGSLSFEQQLET